MSRNIDIYAVCPFFIDPPGSSSKNANIEQKRIRCEGFLADVKMTLDFDRTQKRENWANDFCRTYCWRGCPIAQMIQDCKYPEEANDPAPEVKPSAKSFKIGWVAK